MASSNSEDCPIQSSSVLGSCPGKLRPTADILHVAAALGLGVDYLYSFDEHQRKLAQTVRLKIN